MEKDALFIKVALLAWDQNVKRITVAFSNCSDEELYTEIAPGKNRLVYLLGHLTAVSDLMLPLLNLGQRLYPHLDEIFISKPDKAVTDLPPINELRAQWTEINALLSEHFSKLSADEWLLKHDKISAEDFVNEPHRNRLSVLLSRTNHLAFHMGQIVLVKK